jgi:hypothetical protein
VLLTRAPLYSLPEGNFLARLACVRHAASVRSEPGSNSPDLENYIRKDVAFLTKERESASLKSETSADTLIERIGIHHYPVFKDLVARTRAEPVVYREVRSACQRFTPTFSTLCINASAPNVTTPLPNPNRPEKPLELRGVCRPGSGPRPLPPDAAPGPKPARRRFAPRPEQRAFALHPLMPPSRSP